MKQNTKKVYFPGFIILVSLILFIFSSGSVFARSAYQTAEPDTPVPTNTPTFTPTSTATNTFTSQPAATSTPQPNTQRPMIILNEYSISSGTVSSGNKVVIKVNLRNHGSATANNVRVQFVGGDLVPMQNGGLQVYNSITPNNGITAEQDMQVAYGVWGSASQTVQVAYTSPDGVEFTESFVLYFNAAGSSSGSYATSTPTIMPRPNLIISSYGTDIEDLQAGYIFNLNLNIENQGNSEASNIMMVLGGSVSTVGEGANSEVVITQDDFKNFAPLESSNVHNLGNVYPGGSTSFSQKLVVNTTTEPGAYPLKITFVYDDKNGNKVMDYQVVTLLIYALPKVSSTFYRDTGSIYVGMDTVLPVQITNTGKKSAIFGELNITCDGAMVLNGSSTIGALESGGYFTIDPTVLFAQSGEHELKISIDYTDDFNQERMIEQSMTIVVEEQPVMEMDPYMDAPNGEEFLSPQEQDLPETFLQKIGRFIKGFFGLGSARG